MASFREQGPTERFEKRKLFRFPVQLPVQLGNLEDMSSICTNLSTSGMSAETAQELAIGERLAVKVMISPEEEPLRMVGQVIWRRAINAIDLSDQPIKELGIRFLRPLPSINVPTDEHEDTDLYRDEDQAEYILPRR